MMVQYKKREKRRHYFENFQLLQKNVYSKTSNLSQILDEKSVIKILSIIRLKEHAEA